MTSILYRTIGVLGRILIGLGTLIVLFAAFQYWGTGLAEARDQDDLAAELAARLDAIDADGDDRVNTTDPPDSRRNGEPLSPGTATGAGPLEPAGPPGIGHAAGRIIIPAIDVDKTFVEGVGRDELRRGPGHYPPSPLPGQPGNVAIAGHRTTYGAPFGDLDRLVPGDVIVVETLEGRFTYTVSGHEGPSGQAVGHFIVPPDGTWVLEDQGDSRLTLTACHPKRSAAQRIVVTARLASSPTPGPEPRFVGTRPLIDPDEAPSPGETLGWQPRHGPATMLWAVAATAVALAGWRLGRHWRRRMSHLLTTVGVLGCLWGCFTHLDQLLPAF